MHVGFYEKRDLKRVIDTVAPGPVVLIGSSLGAAVAIQAAVDIPRVTGIVAAEAFSDLRSIATVILRASAAAARGVLLLSRAFRVDGSAWPLRSRQRQRCQCARGRCAFPSCSFTAPTTWTRHRRTRGGIPGGAAGTEASRARTEGGHNQSLNSPAIWDDIDRSAGRARYDTIIGSCRTSPRISSANCRYSRPS